MQAVVGDLYPEPHEKRLILSAIQEFCGPPHGTNGTVGHWNDWKDMNGKKHKGAGVDAIEKARRLPSEYNLEQTNAIPGPAPLRPTRTLPPLNTPVNAAARSIFSNDNTSPMQAGAMETPTAPADTTNTTNQLLQVVLRQQQLLAQAGLLPAQMEQVSHV